MGVIMHTRISLLMTIALLLGACSTPKVPVYDGDQHVQQCTSLLGQALYPPPLSPNILVDRTAQLKAARHDFDEAPWSLENTIWLGRRQGYLGRFDLAVITYTQGLDRHPRNAKLLRRRGHRYITLREFDKAIADLELAAERTGGSPDDVEPDGQPNAEYTPASTLQTNI
jgi:tetratricopeptide (TPR) repeat protein